MKNPLLETFKELVVPITLLENTPPPRYDLLEKYAYGIPNTEVIKYLCSLSPLVEMGAGTGYWAFLIQESGGNIVAYDIKPYKNRYVNGNWSEVKEGTPLILNQFSNRTLFICWPPSHTPFASDCLLNYKGSNLIYVGEPEKGCAGDKGCTGDKEFFRVLRCEWELVKTINIPQFEGVKDYFYHYKRK